jgi:hypothetical protein
MLNQRGPSWGHLESDSDDFNPWYIDVGTMLKIHRQWSVLSDPYESLVAKSTAWHVAGLLVDLINSGAPILTFFSSALRVLRALIWAWPEAITSNKSLSS